MITRIGLAVLLASVAGVGLAHASAESPDRRVAIKAAHLFDSVAGTLTEHGVVVVECGRRHDGHGAHLFVMKEGKIYSRSCIAAPTD